MSGNNRDNHIIEIEDSASTEDYHLTGKGRKDGYEQRFESILKGQFEDRKTWWDAVEKLQEMDDDFATKVIQKWPWPTEETDSAGQVEAIVQEKLREEVISEVLVDLLLDMQQITVDEGLVYVLDNDLEEIPLEVLATQLLKCKANPNKAVGAGGAPPLHLAIIQGNLKLVEELLRYGADLETEYDCGRTPLLTAVSYGVSEGIIKLLLQEGAKANARDQWKQTPLHVAVMQCERDAKAHERDAKAHERNAKDFVWAHLCPSKDVAMDETTIKTFLKHTRPSPKDNEIREKIREAMDKRTNNLDDFVAEQIRELSPFSVFSMFKPAAGGEYQFLEQFATDPELKKSTKAIMDQCVLGKRCVYCKIIEADDHARKGGFDRSKQSLLDVIVKDNDEELAQHPSIRAILDYKWKAFARLLFFLSFMMYAFRMLFFGLALLIAARPDLDNPGCYRDGLDYFRGICEGIAFLLFLIKIGIEIYDMISFGKEYFNFYNYLQWLALILPCLVILFRAATTWCASTGVGYCEEPTLSLNSTMMLDINPACISLSHIQWIFASLAYMANAILVVDYLTLLRTTGVYTRVILHIIVSDMLKFTIMFVVALYVFVGSLYLALRAGVTINMSTGAIISDLEAFRLQTLYPWHVAFTGVRSLIESAGILDGKYFANNDDGQYIGYQWFSIIMYLTFLFAVIVVLLNLLIAQMSDTYTKYQEDAEGMFAIARARIIARLQKRWWQFHKICCSCREFQSCYRPFVWIKLSKEEQKLQQKAKKQEEVLIELAAKLEKKTEERFVLMEQNIINHLTKLTDELTRSLLVRKKASKEDNSGTSDDAGDGKDGEGVDN